MSDDINALQYKRDYKLYGIREERELCGLLVYI